MTDPKEIAARYRRDGVVFPLPALSTAEAAACRWALEAHMTRNGPWPKGRGGQKLNVLLKWASELVHHPAILDHVEAVLGPDILCWQTSVFAKPANDPAYVSWHQDATYWGLDSGEVVTAWVALTPATVKNGCMRVVPGTHCSSQLPHRDTFDPANLLTRGQEIAVEVDEAEAVHVELAAGEMSLHHVGIVHSSPPNRTGTPRIGMAIRYISPAVRQTTGVPDSAMLVRGEDRYGHFELEPPPLADMHPDAVALHERITRSRQRFLFQGADDRAPA